MALPLLEVEFVALLRIRGQPRAVLRMGKGSLPLGWELQFSIQKNRSSRLETLLPGATSHSPRIVAPHQVGHAEQSFRELSRSPGGAPEVDE